MTGVELLSIAAASLVGLGLLENSVHRRRLAAIPTRIHVSGTRGKSSVTRLIAAGLRAAGVQAAAKTTGTLARMILPDAREVPVFRPSGANVIEQIRIIEAAVELGVQTLVLECMALQPWLHWLSENKFVKATHGVITNARPDHLDVMGPTDIDVARCLAGMIPVRGVLFTAEQRHLPTLQMAADDRGTRLIALSEQERHAVTDSDLAKFRYVEHRENVALSLRVLQELDVPRDVALAGMQQARPDPGALTECEVSFFGRQIRFVNAFAANDAQSTQTIWEMATRGRGRKERTIAVFNLRADRPSRTIQLANATFWRVADSIVLMGTGAYLFARIAAKSGVEAGRIVYAERQRVDEVFETIIGCCAAQNLVIGMANIGGPGLALARYFENRAEPGKVTRSLQQQPPADAKEPVEVN